MKQLLEPKVAIAILGPMFTDGFGIKPTDSNYNSFEVRLTTLLSLDILLALKDEDSIALTR